MKRIIVTTSWDDGHQLDARLGALLDAHDIKGTFYVAPRDRESAPEDRLTDAGILELGKSHEIGAHTMTHRSLPSLADSEARAEIRDSKDYLERVLGRPVSSFCYPRGEYEPKHARMAREEGFAYARTVKRHSFGLGKSPFEAETTVNTYNHYSDLWKIARFAGFNPVKTYRYFQWDALAKAMFDRVLETGGIYHLWGHSWEVDEHGDWEKLEQVLSYISRRSGVEYVTNADSRTALPRKLLIATPYFPPQLGGTQLYAYNIAKRLNDMPDWDVRIAASGARGFRMSKDEYRGLRVYRLPYWFKVSNTPLNPWWAFMLRKIMRDEDIAVVNAHMPVVGMADMAALAAGDRPFILTCHSGSMRKEYGRIDALIRAYEAGPLRALFRRADRIVCCSDFVREGFVKKYGSKSVTVTPGVDSERFAPGAKKAPVPTVLFVAGLTRSEQYKGLRILIDAFRTVKASVPDAELSVMGSGDLMETYRDYAESLGLEDSVDFHGRMTGDSLIEQYQLAHVFALPSSKESFGMVILEAMACGLPVVATDGGGIPTLVKEGENGYLLKDNNDAQELARKITMLLTDPILAARLGSDGRAKAKRFDWDDNARRYGTICADATH